MYKVGDLVTMSSNEFLKLAKLGLVLKTPIYKRTVEWSKKREYLHSTWKWRKNLQIKTRFFCVSRRLGL